MSYVDGFVIAVPTANKQAYRDMAAKYAALFREMGADRVVECWGDDVPDGKVTDFRRAVQAKDDETVVFAWVVWPSKEARQEGQQRMMTDERMQPDPDMPFDGKRLIFGGFTPILDTGEGA